MENYIMNDFIADGQTMLMLEVVKNNKLVSSSAAAVYHVIKAYIKYWLDGLVT